MHKTILILACALFLTAGLRAEVDEFATLNGEDRAMLLSLWHAYRDLSPKQQNRLRAYWQKLERMPPEKRGETIEKQIQRDEWKQLTPEERRQMRDRQNPLELSNP